MSKMSKTIQPDNSVAIAPESGLYTRWLDVTLSHLEEGDSLILTFYLSVTLGNGATKRVSKSVRVTDPSLQRASAS